MKSSNDKSRKSVHLEGRRREEGGEEEGDFLIIPPNGGWGWVVVVCAFYCNVILDGIQLTFGLFLKSISEDFNTKTSTVALAGSLMFGCHLLMGPICAGCNAVFGLRSITITGSLLSCFGIGISYFSTGIWYLYFSFGVIGGMGFGLIYMNTLVITSLYFTTLMPIALGIVVCGTGVGTMVFTGLGHFLLQWSSWRFSFLIEAILAGSMSFAALSFKPLKPMKVKVTSKAESSRARGSVFIKTDMPGRASVFSVATYQTIPWSLGDTEIEGESKTYRCSPCCRKEEKLREKKLLLLSEIESSEPYPYRKSYVGKLEEESEEEEEEEVILTDKISQKSIYTRVDYPTKKSKKHFLKDVKRTLVIMLDCRLLSSCNFLIFTVSGAIALAAFLIVFIYEKDRCEHLGFDEETSTYFVLALGGFNVFWRLCLGVVALYPKVKFWAISISGLTLGGIAVMLSGYSSNLLFQFAFCFIFCLSMSSFAVFRIPITIDLVGQDFLENATGINLLFMGVFCITLPPLVGLVREASNSFNVLFIITGSLLIIAGLSLIGVKKVDTSKIKKKSHK